MKQILLFSFIAVWSVAAVFPLAGLAQDSINPYNIQQHGTILLQSTDVYYNPFAPPGLMDTRLNLCNESDQLRDPNGLGDPWRAYFPIVYDTSIIHDTSLHKYDTLADWAPYGTPTTWQRGFFFLRND